MTFLMNYNPLHSCLSNLAEMQGYNLLPEPHNRASGVFRTVTVRCQFCGHGEQCHEHHRVYKMVIIWAQGQVSNSPHFRIYLSPEIIPEVISLILLTFLLTYGFDHDKNIYILKFRTSPPWDFYLFPQWLLRALFRTQGTSLRSNL